MLEHVREHARAVRAGADDVVEKPINRVSLIQSVNHFMRLAMRGLVRVPLETDVDLTLPAEESQGRSVNVSRGGIFVETDLGCPAPDTQLRLSFALPEAGQRIAPTARVVWRRFETEGMEKTGDFYAYGPARVQLLEKDPLGWKEFRDRLVAGSATGHALTMRGVQMRRPTIYSLEPRLTLLEVPTLVVTGDEDEPCLEPGLFMKRKIPTSGLVVLPKSGHAVNLEEPDAFNRAVLDFLTAVDAGRWTRRRPDSIAKSGILPAGR